MKGDGGETDLRNGEARLRSLLAAGHFETLRELCTGELRKAPSAPLLLYYLGLALEGLGGPKDAVRFLTAACDLGGDAGMAAQLARILSLLRRDAEASRWADSAVAQGLHSALDIDTVGCVYSRLGRYLEAAELFRAAVAAEPGQPQFRYNLATSLGFVGHADALDEHERLLALAPSFARSHLAIATGSGTEGADERAARIEQALDQDPTADDALLLHISASRELEKIGRHREAFAHLQRGKRARRTQLNYDPARDAKVVEALETAFADPNYFSGPGFADFAPVFVIGMPRSGTTLVERILTSHPALASAGELQAMPLALKIMSGVRTGAIIDPPTIRSLAAMEPAALGRAYLERAAPHVDTSRRFVDKLPMNFLYAAHIARAFPDATIICLRRDPMDVVWSNYKHLFAPGVPTFDYSYDPADCARYIAGFEHLVRFWHALMPGRIFDVRYEDLVATPEEQIRGLVDHAGLEWSDACLEFFANAQPVATPSAAQVRRPIHAGTVGNWRHHAAELEQARAILRRHGYA